MRLTYAAEIRVDRPEQVDQLVRLAADAEVGLTVFEPEAEQSEPERFSFDRESARDELESGGAAIDAVNAYSDADEYHDLVDAALGAGIIGRRRLTSSILIYPMALAEPDPLVAVEVAGHPTLLTYLPTPIEREGETPVAFTLWFLERVVEAANSLLDR